jgi:hypothetical protein
MCWYKNEGLSQNNNNNRAGSQYTCLITLLNDKSATILQIIITNIGDQGQSHRTNGTPTTSLDKELGTLPTTLAA